MTLHGALEAAAIEVLAAPPRVPRDPALFTSNQLFGEPGLYPGGPPMAPATGHAPDGPRARQELERVLTARGLDRRRGRAVLARFEEDRVARALPDPGVRAALLVLSSTVAAPVADGFPESTTARHVRFGTPDSSGRVVGPARAADGSTRVVNDRYQAEHPASIAPSLAHDLLWTPATTGHAAEALLHALVAMVHVQLIARVPDLARSGTELARRQSSLAISLLHSRRPGSHRISLVAPHGPGTIPGGNPAMQTPDFWSIPFAPPGDDDAPRLLGAVLDGLVDPAVARPEPLRFDDGLATWLDEHRDDRRWLPLEDQVRASVVLGLLGPADLAAAAGLSEEAVVEAFGLTDALAPGQPSW